MPEQIGQRGRPISPGPAGSAHRETPNDMKPRNYLIIAAAAIITSGSLAEFAELYWMTGAFALIAVVALLSAIANSDFG